MAAIPMDELNLIGNEESAAPPRRSRLIVWLIMAGMMLLFVPLYLAAATMKEAATPLQTELEQLQATLAVTPSLPPEEAELSATLMGVMGEAAGLEAAAPTISGAHINWPAAMAALTGYDPARLTLTGMSQNAFRLTLDGEAADERAVIEYARNLEASGQFGRVNIQAISMKPRPTATPSRTATPTPDPNLTPMPTVETAPVVETAAAPMAVVFSLTIELRPDDGQPA